MQVSPVLCGASVLPYTLDYYQYLDSPTALYILITRVGDQIPSAAIDNPHKGLAVIDQECQEELEQIANVRLHKLPSLPKHKLIQYSAMHQVVCTVDLLAKDLSILRMIRYIQLKVALIHQIESRQNLLIYTDRALLLSVLDDESLLVYSLEDLLSLYLGNPSGRSDTRMSPSIKIEQSSISPLLLKYLEYSRDTGKAERLVNSSISPVDLELSTRLLTNDPQLERLTRCGSYDEAASILGALVPRFSSVEKFLLTNATSYFSCNWRLEGLQDIQLVRSTGLLPFYRDRPSLVENTKLLLTKPGWFYLQRESELGYDYISYGTVKRQTVYTLNQVELLLSSLESRKLQGLYNLLQLHPDAERLLKRIDELVVLDSTAEVEVEDYSLLQTLFEACMYLRGWKGGEDSYPIESRQFHPSHIDSFLNALGPIYSDLYGESRNPTLALRLVFRSGDNIRVKICIREYLKELLTGEECLRAGSSVLLYTVSYYLKRVIEAEPIH